MNLNKYFEKFRKGVIGYNQSFKTPYGKKKLVYADWTASGRLYKPLEDKILKDFAPFIGNTHTDSTLTGTAMTYGYEEAKKIIKNHVGASSADVLIATGSGMTSAVCKLQRILGLKLPENFTPLLKIDEISRPVVFVTHMEHHSNHTSWLETIADVVLIHPDPKGQVDLTHLENLLKTFEHRKIKIAAVTACSNVTGLASPYYQIAKIMHAHRGFCFVDFACSAPYVQIKMRPKNSEEKLDAIYFSPHKFLGGPGSAGILIFDSRLYKNFVPDHPGGGTVTWTNPWGGRKYYEDIESREDGGTPPFLQTIRVALAIKLKEKMGLKNLASREKEIVSLVFLKLKKIPNLNILDGQLKNRLAVFSFTIQNLHYNLAVKILNDRYGIQARGGCACAGTYGHYLFHVNEEESKKITDRIDQKDLSIKPGFIRISLHPIISNQEINFILKSIEELALNFSKWQKDYVYDSKTNEFRYRKYKDPLPVLMKKNFVI